MRDRRPRRGGGQVGVGLARGAVGTRRLRDLPPRRPLERAHHGGRGDGRRGCNAGGAQPSAGQAASPCSGHRAAAAFPARPLRPPPPQRLGLHSAAQPAEHVQRREPRVGVVGEGEQDQRVERAALGGPAWRKAGRVSA